VSGLTIRTKNHDERSPETAKIGAIWSLFLSKGVIGRIPNRLPDAPVIGVYSAYESDANGSYNVTAGVPVSAPVPDFDCVEIAEGNYLVFEARGAMPDAVVQTWESIWAYFAEHPDVQRTYLTDFEAYCGADEVRIHIGVVA